MSQDSPSFDATVDRPSRIRYRVLGWMCLIAAIAYIQRNSIAVTKEGMAEELDFSPDQVGTILMWFYVGYSLFQIPGGLLRDLWGTKVTLIVVVLGGSLATALMAAVTDATSAMVTWLAVGAFQAALFPCAISAIRHWFPVTERATASGWLASCMSLGGAAGTALAGALIDSVTWRVVFALFAVPGVLWALFFALAYRSRPQWHPRVNDAELRLILGEATTTEPATDTVHGPTPWLQILFMPSLVALYTQQFFRAAGQVFYGTWFPTYLQQARGVDMGSSGLLSSLPQLAIMAGALVGGVLSDTLLRRTGSHRWAYQTVACVSLSVCAALILASYFVADPTLAVIVISLGSFCGSLAGPSAYAVSIEKGRKHLSTVFSTMNMSGNIGAVMTSKFLPDLVAATSWNVVLFSFAGLFAAATLCWLAITPHGAVRD